MAAAVLAVLSAWPGAGAAEERAARIVVASFTAGTGVDPRTAEPITAAVASVLARQAGFQILWARETLGVLTIERQKRLAQCADNVPCLSELGQSMGAAFVLSGSLTRLGTSSLFTVALINARTGLLEQRYASRLSGGDEAFADEIAPALDALFPRAPKLLPPTRWAHPTAETSRPVPPAGAPTAARFLPPPPPPAPPPTTPTTPMDMPLGPPTTAAGPPAGQPSVATRPEPDSTPLPAPSGGAAEPVGSSHDKTPSPGVKRPPAAAALLDARLAEPPARSRVVLGGRFQIQPDANGGAFTMLAVYRVSDVLSIGGGAQFGRFTGVLARAAYIPFASDALFHPLLSVELPLLFSAPLSAGLGGGLGLEARPRPWLMVAVEVPVAFFLTAPEGSRLFYSFAAASLAIEL